MDANLERQVIRVLGAFQRAADEHWGQEITIRAHEAAKPKQRIRGEDPKRQVARDFLRANPDASGREIARIANVRERYAQDVIKRLKWEKSRS